MTLENTIRESLAGWRPNGEGPHTRSIAFGDVSVELAAAQCDALAARLWSLRVTRHLSETDSAGDLADRAARLANRVTGLLEPLRVYEVDRLGDRALLRSATPDQSDGATQFHELLLSGRLEAELKRYRVEAGESKRSAVPYTLTHEVIGKVVRILGE